MLNLFYFLGLTALLSSPQISSAQIFGSDDRKEPFEISSDLAALGNPVASITYAGAEAYAFQQYVGPGKTGALCSDTRFYNQPFFLGCSGVLISPTHVLTAGHCYLKPKCGELNEIYFNFRQLQQSDNPVKSRTEKYTCKQVVFTKTTSQSEDYAVIELDRPVQNIAPAELDLSGITTPEGTNLALIGHPFGLPQKFSTSAEILKDFSQNSTYLTNLDAHWGTSGGPVYNLATRKVIGVLVRGLKDLDFDSKNKCFRFPTLEPSIGKTLTSSKGTEVMKLSTIAELLKSLPGVVKP